MYIFIVYKLTIGEGNIMKRIFILFLCLCTCLVCTLSFFSCGDDEGGGTNYDDFNGTYYAQDLDPDMPNREMLEYITISGRSWECRMYEGINEVKDVYVDEAEGVTYLNLKLGNIEAIELQIIDGKLIYIDGMYTVTFAKDAPLHVHTASEYEKDENGHRLICSECNQAFRSSEHDGYESSYDENYHYTSCVCGYIIEDTKAAHNLQMYSTDEETHLMGCYECEYSFVGDHEMAYAPYHDYDWKHIYACKVCEYSSTGDEECQYNVPHHVDEEGHHYACVCGKIGLTLDHNTVMYTNESEHWDLCTECDMIIDKVPHLSADDEGSYSLSDENSHWMNCICHTEIAGTREDHDFSSYRDLNDGCHMISCSGCGFVSNYGEAHLVSENHFDKDFHWTSCICGNVAQKISHEYTSTINGDTHTVSCDCGFSETSAHTHTLKFDDQSHWTACVCGDTKDWYNHTLSSDYDSTHHWEKCECGYESLSYEHDYNQNQFCKVCNIAHYTEGLEYKLSDDGKYYICVGIGSSGSSDIYIADTYNGLPVKEIGNSAFASTYIRSVFMHDNIEKIGREAFFSCTSLQSVTLSNNTLWIDATAFNNCNNLVYEIFDTGLYLGSASNKYHALIKTNTNNSDPVTSCNIHSDTKMIANSAFSSAYLNAVDITDNVVAIGNNAFYRQENLTIVEIGSSVKYIGQEAFRACYKLSTVNNGANVTEIGNDAFYGCVLLSSFSIPQNLEFLGDNAFYACEKLLSVSLPDTLVYLGNGAFSGCTGLTLTQLNGTGYLGNSRNPYLALIKVATQLSQVTIHEDTRFIYGNAFSGCSDLTEINIHSGIIGIGSFAFSNCTKLSSVTMTDSVKYIGNGAFSGCSALQSITLPSKITEIKSSTFQNSALTSIVIPDSVTFIGEYAFDGCTNLASVILSSSLKTIDYRAFNNCTALNEIVIPASVTRIDPSAFRGCTNLTEITFENTENWYQEVYNYGTGENDYTEIPSSDLATAESAAICIKDKYSGHDWVVKE